MSEQRVTTPPQAPTWVFLKLDILAPKNVAALGTMTITANDTGGLSPAPHGYITAEEDPVLAELWDNDEDAVYDSL